MTNEQFNLSMAFTVRYLESDNENENRIFRQAEQKVLSCTPEEFKEISKIYHKLVDSEKESTQDNSLQKYYLRVLDYLTSKERKKKGMDTQHISELMNEIIDNGEAVVYLIQKLSNVETFHEMFEALDDFQYNIGVQIQEMESEVYGILRDKDEAKFAHIQAYYGLDKNTLEEERAAYFHDSKIDDEELEEARKKFEERINR